MAASAGRGEIVAALVPGAAAYQPGGTSMRGPMAFSLVLSGVCCGSCARRSSLTEALPGGPKTASDAEPEDLAPALLPSLERHGLPALAAAVVMKGRTVAVGAVGVRRAGSDVKVTRDDAFHIGSCTKAMTATVIAMLVEQGKLAWETTLAEALPAGADRMHPAYRAVTLLQLLSHRAGLPPPERSWPKGMSFLDVHRLPGPPRAQRAGYVAMILAREPEVAPGSKYVYSNAGYAVAGAVAEHVADASWEDLMESMLFKPLGMSTAGFGAPGTPGKTDEPWQHRSVLGTCVPVPPGPLSDNPPAIAPAGTVHCSIGAWAKFVAFHLEKGRGKGMLRPASFEVLHEPAFGGDYAPGWIVTEREWGGGRVLTHAGSNTMSFAVAWLAPERHFAVLVATNQGGKKASKACDEVASALVRGTTSSQEQP